MDNESISTKALNVESTQRPSTTKKRRPTKCVSSIHSGRTSHIHIFDVAATGKRAAEDKHYEDYGVLMTYHYEQYRKSIAESNGLNKCAVFDALAAAGITNLVVEFDGWGDSGQIQGITAYSGETTVELPEAVVSVQALSDTSDSEPLRTVEKALSEAVETLCYSYLEESHGGWEISDGSFGDFAFDVAARTIQLVYNGRISDVITECEEF